MFPLRKVFIKISKMLPEAWRHNFLENSVKFALNICFKCSHFKAVMRRANCQNRFAYEVTDDAISSVNYVPTVHHQGRKTAFTG